MIEGSKVLWNFIDYPLYILIVIGFIWLIARANKSKSEHPDNVPNDPTGNSNIRKKWYDFT